MAPKPPASPISADERAARLQILQDQVALMRRYAAATGEAQHARWLLKEVVYRVWERPQIPKPRFDKYSLWFLWSPRARQRLATYAPGAKRPDIRGLRLEHVIPRGILAAQLMERHVDDLASFLDAHFRTVVITVEDDHQLNQHGMQNKMPGGWQLGDDPWVRYEKAGFRRSSFVAPCAERPELASDTPPAAQS